MAHSIPIRNAWHSTLSSLDTTIDWDTPKIEPMESPLVRFTDDPLALSCASYRLWATKGQRWVQFDDCTITLEDRYQATEIRRYYLHRYTMERLRGKELSKFQQLMVDFLNDARPLRKNELGMLYRLPYFYKEDQALDEVFSTGQSIENLNSPHQLTVKTTLKPVKQILRSRRSGEYVQFWFTDENNNLALHSVKADNPLMSFFKSAINRPEVKVATTRQLNSPTGRTEKMIYWKLTNMELVD